MSILDRRSDLRAICPVDRLIPERGIAALVDGRAVAVFVLGTGELVAVDNVDPISGASVLSRGLVGDVDGTPTIASPIYKQRFDLRTGRCIDLPEDMEGVSVAVHHVEVIDGTIHVGLRT